MIFPGRRWSSFWAGASRFAEGKWHSQFSCDTAAYRFRLPTIHYRTATSVGLLAISTIRSVVVHDY